VCQEAMATGRFERILSEEDSAHLLEELNSGKITVSDLMVTLSLSSLLDCSPQWTLSSAPVNRVHCLGSMD
jgi:hypothetical protein